MNRVNVYKNIDWTLIIMYLVLVLLGWTNIYAASIDFRNPEVLNFSANYGKQIIWIVTAVFMVVLLLAIDARFYESFAFLIYGFFILLLIVVLLFGKEVAGSKSWFEIGFIRIQPAEFAKFATLLALARYLGSFETNFSKLSVKIIAFAIFLFPMALVLLQNDTGSALIFFAFIIVLFRMGLSGKIVFIGFLSAVLFILTLIIDKFLLISILSGIAIFLIIYIYKKFKNNRTDIAVVVAFLVLTISLVLSVDYVFENVLEDHQRKRINVFLGIEHDPHGAGYNVLQAKIAIGSGGLAGKGFLQGTQTKYDFVPEQSTDFIFCTVGEEWGFLGTTAVVILFAFFLIRIIKTAERQRSDFSRIYGYGVASILLFHFVVNIGMTIGLAPVIGIPLPFFSYGGSSLWAFTILLFIFIKLDSNRMDILW